jgi:hypothetical protein
MAHIFANRLTINRTDDHHHHIVSPLKLFWGVTLSAWQRTSCAQMLPLPLPADRYPPAGMKK